MGRKKQLSEYEKGQITAYHQQRLSNRQIAKLLGRTPTVVGSFLNNPANYGKKKSSGRPSKVSERDRRRIIRKASNSVKSCKDIREELDLDVHRRTVLRVIHMNPNIRRRKLRKAPAIRKENRKKRVDFARRSMRKDWSEVSHFKS